MSFSSRAPCAADYYVRPTAPGASDDGPGTAERPWKTIAKAAATVQAGDTVFLRAGTYAEAVAIKNAGAPSKPIVFAAFGDEEVILEGADAVAAERWRLAPNGKNIYAIALERDPARLFVDGKAVYPKVDQTRKEYPRAYRLAPDRRGQERLSL